MKNNRETGSDGSGVETTLPDIILKDDDGKEFKLSGDLIGKRLSLVGIADKHNHDLIMALRKTWLDFNGNLTEAGQEEENRRAKATKDAGVGNRAGVGIIEARKGLLRTLEKKTGDPKEQIRMALAKYGYTGQSELKKTNGSGNYTLKFFNTNGQAEEGIVFVGSIGRLLDAIDKHVGRISKE